MKTAGLVVSAVVVAAVLVVPAPRARAGWGGLTRIAEVAAQPNAESVAKFVSAPPHACWGSGPDGVHEYFYKIGGNPPTANEKLIYATLLTALVASKNVWVTTGGCENGYERIAFVSIQP